MPLKDRDRSRPRRLVRLGMIRLGYKEKRQRSDGSEYEFPVQADHFILTDAPEIAAAYPGDVRELDVILPFPDIERNFDAAYTVWAGGVLVCKGDGESVQYAGSFRTEEKSGKMRVYNAPGDTLVSDGAAVVPFDWNGQHFNEGDLVPCPGANRDYYPQCRACKMSAILKVMMARPDLFRMGYYQIATGSGRNYDTLLGTLELIHEQAGKVNGIPFKLRLAEESTSYRDDSGTRRQVDKWFLQLEPDPTFTRKLYARQATALLGDGLDDTPQRHQQPPPSWDVIDEEAPPPFAEDEGPATEEIEGEIDGNVSISSTVIAAGLTQNQYSFNGAMKRLGLPADADEETITNAFKSYRAARDNGLDSAAAAAQARMDRAMSYTTDSGKVLGKLSITELTQMIDQINDLPSPTAKMREIKGNCKLLIEYLKQFEE